MIHEAGRELDALIAEKIMGWANCGEEFNEMRGSPPEWAKLGHTDRSLPVPHYSTDIATAWLLIDQHPHYVLLTRSADATRFGFADHMTWKCRFYAPQSFEAEADTAPLAICRAALLAQEHTL